MNFSDRNNKKVETNNEIHGYSWSINLYVSTLIYLLSNPIECGNIPFTNFSVSSNTYIAHLSTLLPHSPHTECDNPQISWCVQFLPILIYEINSRANNLTIPNFQAPFWSASGLNSLSSNSFCTLEHSSCMTTFHKCNHLGIWFYLQI